MQAVFQATLAIVYMVVAIVAPLHMVEDSNNILLVDYIRLFTSAASPASLATPSSRQEDSLEDIMLANGS